jgi:hypothetical protein
MSPKVTTTKGKGVGACSLARNTSRVEGCAKALGWGLGRWTSKSIIHTNLHKPNDNFVSAWNPFGARMNHHSPNLREPATFPLIVFSMPGHGANTQMSFCPETPTLKIPKIKIFATLETHNFVCIPPIEMRSKKKL